MTLPELPRQNKSKEADFGVTFRHWIEKNPRHSCAFELKQTTEDSIPFSCVDEKQLVYGMAIKSDKGILIRVQGMNGEPDYVWCRSMPYCVVIKYPSMFCLIDVETFILEKERSKRKSLTSSRASEIAISVIHTKK